MLSGIKKYMWQDGAPVVDVVGSALARAAAAEQEDKNQKLIEYGAQVRALVATGEEFDAERLYWAMNALGLKEQQVREDFNDLHNYNLERARLHDYEPRLRSVIDEKRAIVARIENLETELFAAREQVRTLEWQEHDLTGTKSRCEAREQAKPYLFGGN